MTVRKEIQTDSAPEAIGPYSQGVVAGSTLYVSGQIGVDPVTGERVEGGIEAETRQIMKNLLAVLSEVDLSEENVQKTTVYLQDLADYEQFNEVYGTFFSKPYPARACVEVAELPAGARVEVELVASPE